jgi:hypothetical protein
MKLAEFFEWCLSFVSEPKDDNCKLKGSSKRLSSLLLIVTFMFFYRLMSYSYTKKIDALENSEFLDLVRVNGFIVPDIPMYWVLIICGIIGITIADSYFKKTK